MLNPEEVLPKYRGWIWAVAMRLEAYDRQRQEDLAQEGYYAMWEALKTFDPSKGSLPSYLTRAALQRMQRAQERDLFTGTPGTRGHRREKPAIPMDTTPGGDEEPGWLDIQLSCDLGDVEMAYHHGEIMQAINSLTERERTYVYLRFWHGYSNPEIQQVIGGGNPSGLWTHTDRGIKVKLRRQLGHLATAV